MLLHSAAATHHNTSATGKKKHSDRKLHPNELLHDTKDHFFKLKFICSRNRVCPPGHTRVTVEIHIQVANSGDPTCKHIHAHTDNTLSSSKTITFLCLGPVVLPIRPTVLSLERHMPLLGKILMHTKSSLFQQQHLLSSVSYWNSPFIAFPQDFILYTVNSHLQWAEYCTKKSLLALMIWATW